MALSKKRKKLRAIFGGKKETRGRKPDPKKNPAYLKQKGSKDRQIYMDWVSIPATLRLLPPAELEKMGYPTDDPLFMKLLSIRRKGELAREFGFSPDMPSVWEKQPDFWEQVNARTQKQHVMKFRKDVDFAFTQKVIRHGDANRVKLWKQLHEGWSERTEAVNVNLNVTPADLVKEIEERNAKLRGEA